MKRGTTPTIAFTLDNIEFSLIDKAELTIVQNGEKKIIKLLTINVENSGMFTTLSQEETLSLTPGKCTVQVKILFNDGSVIATDIQTLDVQTILNDEVLT